MMHNVKEIHLKDYLPNVIKKFGYAILHADGNIFVDLKADAKGRPVDEKHQPSFLHKEYASPQNEAATYSIKFTNVNQIPDTLEDLEKMFLSEKAKEKAEKNKITLAPDQLVMDVESKEEVKEIKPETEIKEKGKPGRKPNK
jgi:hypothetical protein